MRLFCFNTDSDFWVCNNTCVKQRQRVAVEGWGVVSSTVLGVVIPRDAGNTAVNNIYGNSFSSSFAAPDVWRTIDIARNTYQNGIRNNLIF